MIGRRSLFGRMLAGAVGIGFAGSGQVPTGDVAMGAPTRKAGGLLRAAFLRAHKKATHQSPGTITVSPKEEYTLARLADLKSISPAYRRIRTLEAQREREFWDRVRSTIIGDHHDVQFPWQGDAPDVMEMAKKLLSE